MPTRAIVFELGRNSCAIGERKVYAEKLITNRDYIPLGVVNFRFDDNGSRVSVKRHARSEQFTLVAAHLFGQFPQQFVFFSARQFLLKPAQGQPHYVTVMQFGSDFVAELQP